jgi:hypothetical protein
MVEWFGLLNDYNPGGVVIVDLNRQGTDCDRECPAKGAGSQDRPPLH